jgi:hypothetical protein
MKKPLALLGVTAVLFLACNVNWSDLTMPEEVKIEGMPGLYLPLAGNLFSGEFEKYSPEKLIKDNLSPGKLKEMIGGDMSGIAVSAYEDPADPDAPLTYVLRYPLAEMPYDFSEYMVNLEIEAPSISLNVGSGIPLPPGMLLPRPIDFPLVEADIRDMANLVSELKYTRFGVTIAGNFEGALKVSITDGNAPANGGFALISTGTYDADDGCTRFEDSSSEGKIWKPSKDHSTLTIAMTLLKYPSAVDGDGRLTIAPKFVFDWIEATVNPGDYGTLEGELPLDFQSLGETLGGIRFPDKGIKAYLYTKGLPRTDATITLVSTFGGSATPVVDGAPLEDADAPELPSGDAPYAGPIPPSSLAGKGNPDGAIDLTGTLNSSLSGEVTLNYEVAMGSVVLNKSELEKKDQVISAVLLVKLPLALKYSGATFDSPGDYKNGSVSVVKSDYLKFEMDGLDLSDIFGDDDLLEPIKGAFDGGGVSGHLDITRISLVLANCDATLLPGVSIAIKQNKTANAGVLIDLSNSTGKDVPINFDLDPAEPFAPSIDILLKKDFPSGDSAMLSLKRDGRFRFGLIVEIESALDATVALQGVK